MLPTTTILSLHSIHSFNKVVPSLHSYLGSQPISSFFKIFRLPVIIACWSATVRVPELALPHQRRAARGGPSVLKVRVRLSCSWEGGEQHATHINVLQHDGVSSALSPGRCRSLAVRLLWTRFCRGCPLVVEVDNGGAARLSVVCLYMHAVPLRAHSGNTATIATTTTVAVLVGLGVGIEHGWIQDISDGEKVMDGRALREAKGVCVRGGKEGHDGRERVDERVRRGR